MEPETDWGHKKVKHILQQDQHYLGMSRYRNVSEAGTIGSSSPLNTSHSSSADSPAGSDDLDAQPDKNEPKNEQSQEDPKKKDAHDARTHRKKQSK